MAATSASSGQPAGSLFTHKSATIMQQLSCIATSRILLRNSLVFFADDAACRSCSTSHHPQSPPSFSSLPSIQGTQCVLRRLVLSQLTGEGASLLKSRQKTVTYTSSVPQKSRHNMVLPVLPLMAALAGLNWLDGCWPTSFPCAPRLAHSLTCSRRESHRFQAS